MKFENKNNPIELRPRCKIIDINISKDDLINKINDGLVTGNNIAIGTFFDEDNRFELKVPPSQRHFWSPKLLLWVEGDNDKTSLSCVFSPNYKIWNLFIFLYAISFLLIISGLILGIYQKANKEDPLYFWLVPAGLLLMLLINVAARIGQYWGKTQVEQLKSFVSMIIEKKI